MLLNRELHQSHDYIINIINPHTTWWCESDITFHEPPTQDKNSHRLCKPKHVKPIIIAYHLCQKALKWKLLHKIEKWCKFSSRIKAKCTKRTHVKSDLPVLFQETEKICYCNQIQTEDKNTNKITWTNTIWAVLTHCGLVTQICVFCVFALQLWKTDDANLPFNTRLVFPHLITQYLEHFLIWSSRPDFKKKRDFTLN
jgi:hypothetical protein